MYCYEGDFDGLIYIPAGRDVVEGICEKMNGAADFGFSSRWTTFEAGESTILHLHGVHNSDAVTASLDTLSEYLKANDLAAEGRVYCNDGQGGLDATGYANSLIRHIM